MKKYITTFDTPILILELMGRKKEFRKNEEVNYDAYIKAYPKHFKQIGEITGYNSFLAVPTFIPDPIEEFTQREAIRKKAKKAKIENKIELSEVDIEEIATELEESIEEIYDVDLDKADLVDAIEEILDVKFETEE